MQYFRLMQWRNAGQSVVYRILKTKNPEKANKKSFTPQEM